MTPTEKNSRTSNNVTNLDEVRQAKARARDEEFAAAQRPDDLDENRTFDAEKVARIKAAIAAGEYEIDPARVADKFIEHDRNQ